MQSKNRNRIRPEMREEACQNRKSQGSSGRARGRRRGGDEQHRHYRRRTNLRLARKTGRSYPSPCYQSHHVYPCTYEGGPRSTTAAEAVQHRPLNKIVSLPTPFLYHPHGGSAAHIGRRTGAAYHGRPMWDARASGQLGQRDDRLYDGGLKEEEEQQQRTLAAEAAAAAQPDAPSDLAGAKGALGRRVGLMVDARARASHTHPVPTPGHDDLSRWEACSAPSPSCGRAHHGRRRIPPTAGAWRRTRRAPHAASGQRSPPAHRLSSLRSRAPPPLGTQPEPGGCPRRTGGAGDRLHPGCWARRPTG